MSDDSGTGDTEVFVDALDEIRQALPDEHEDEFHDAVEDSGSSESPVEITNDEDGPSPSREFDNEDDAVLPAKSKEEEEKERLLERERLESDLDKEELERRFNKGQALKAEGNDLFRDGEYDEAITKYSEALEICPLSYVKERSIMFSNRAACRVKKGESEIALEDCNKALELHPAYMKCLIRRAEVEEQLEKLDEALEDYQKILEMDPSNGAARMKCVMLPERIRERNEKMKEEMMGQLKNLGNMILKPFGLSTDNFQLQQDPNSGGYSINFKQ